MHNGIFRLWILIFLVGFGPLNQVRMNSSICLFYLTYQVMKFLFFTWWMFTTWREWYICTLVCWAKQVSLSLSKVSRDMDIWFLDIVECSGYFYFFLDKRKQMRVVWEKPLDDSCSEFVPSLSLSAHRGAYILIFGTFSDFSITQVDLSDEMWREAGSKCGLTINNRVDECFIVEYCILLWTTTEFSFDT